MGYYYLRLNQSMRNKCTIILSWGKYCYNALPMGFVGSSNIFQYTLGSLFLDLSHVLVYLDDIIVSRNATFSKHIELLEEVLGRLSKSGFQVHPEKSHWATNQVVDILFLLSQEGIQPQPKNI